MTTSMGLALNNATLPTELTSFVGRHDELARLHELLDGSWLVVLTGSAGVGKTRLAAKAAANRSTADGVWFVELASVTDPIRLPDAVASALGIRTLGRPPLSTLIEYVADREALLVLDNCEHLLSACAELVAQLLRSCPRLRVLATSREALGIMGEAVLMVPPLPVPNPDQRDQAPIASYDSVTLFAERAAGAVPGHHLTEAEMAAVAEICFRLDGIPLAIELAAGRVKALSVRQILDRLSDPYRLLTGGSRTAPDRLRTLRSSIAWSYELCTPAERWLWRRLSIFVGGWELDTAEYIGARAPLSEDADTVDILQSLVEKSIVVRHQHHERVWYSMLVTIREYGLAMLAEHDEIDGARTDHARWVGRVLAACEQDWIGPRQPYWLARAHDGLPNIREALECYLERDAEADDLFALLVPAWRVTWLATGRLDELRRWLGRALARPGAPSPLRSQALSLFGFLAALHGDSGAATEYLNEARAMADELGDRISHALADTATAYAMEDSPEAVALYEHALQALHDWPSLMVRSGAPGRLAVLYDRLGDQENAARVGASVLALGDAHGERYESSYLLLETGMLAWRRGELDRAADLTLRALKMKRELDDAVGAALASQTLAAIAADRNDIPRAATLLGVSHLLWQHSGAAPGSFPAFLGQREACEQKVRAVLTEQQFREHFNTGARRPVSEAIDLALDGDVTASRPGPDSGTGVDLTRREHEIAALVAQGLSNKEIAARLVISTRTAEGHVQRLLTKLAFTSRTQLATWVLQNSPTEK